MAGRLERGEIRLYRFAPPDSFSDNRLQFLSVEELRAIREDIATITQSGVADGAGGTPDARWLDRILDDFNIYSFFENVWLPFAAEDATRSTMRDVADAARSLGDERLKSAS